MFLHQQKSNNIFFYAFIASLLIISNVRAVNGEECEVTEFSVLCKNIVDKFPKFSVVKPSPSRFISFMRDEFGSLKCQNCSLPVLEKDTFQNDVDINTFDLRSSNVTTIKSDAFAKLNKRSLRNIILEDNKIDTIENGAFNFKDDAITKPAFFVALNLKKNRISNIADNLFANLTTQILDLSENLIRKFSSNTFNNLIVGYLNLSQNAIEEIEEAVFLSTTFNAITLFRVYEAYDFKIPTCLNLKGNKIRQIVKHAFIHIGTLHSLLLNDNLIERIEIGAFDKLDDLRELKLNNNKIDSLQGDVFNGLINLESLTLDHNNIKTIPLGLFKSLPNLTSLRLSNNLIETLNPSSFSGLTSLQTLDVSYNKISNIEPSHLFVLAKLLELNIAGNRLQNLNLKEILVHNRQLVKINFIDNFWNCKSLVNSYHLLILTDGHMFGTSSYYNVPNLHGIPCYRSKKFVVNENMNFTDFVNSLIADGEIASEDLFDVEEVKEDASNAALEEYARKQFSILCYLSLLITIFIVIYLANFLMKFLRTRNGKNPLSFDFSRDNEKIELINQV